LIDAKIIAFDLDNTIYDEYDYFIKVIEEAKIKISLEREDFRIIRSESNDILSSILKKYELFSEVNKNILFEKYKTIKNEVKVSIASTKTIDTISKYYNTCILTNGIIQVQKNKIRTLSIDNLFNEILFARSAGMENEKPSHKSFQMICDHFQCEQREVVFVGDHPINDIQGAKKTGMTTVWISEFTTHKEIPPEADYHIRSLSDLSKILGINK